LEVGKEEYLATEFFAALSCLVYKLAKNSTQIPTQLPWWVFSLLWISRQHH